MDDIKNIGISILGTLLFVSIVSNALMYWSWTIVNDKNIKLETELGVVAAMSQAQEVKVVEAKKVEEKVKIVTQDKIKVVKEYVYDNNKSDCDNAINVLTGTF